MKIKYLIADLIGIYLFGLMNVFTYKAYITNNFKYPFSVNQIDMIIYNVGYSIFILISFMVWSVYTDYKIEKEINGWN